MAVPVRGHKGGARPTTLSGALSNSALSFTVTAGGGTGFPDGSTGVFVVTLDAGLAGEEKVLCAGRSVDTFTVPIGGRGYDNTVASSHANLASVAHTYAAIEAQEANDHIVDATRDDHTQYALVKKSLAALRGAAGRSMKLHYGADSGFLSVDDGTAWHDFQDKASADAAYAPLSGSTNYVSPTLVDAKGDLLVGTADNTLARKAVGSDGQVLTADAASAGGVKWAAPSASTVNPAFLGHVAALGVMSTAGGVGTASLAEYVRIRPLANVSVTTIRAYIGNGVTSEVGIYSSTGTGSAARPNAKLVSATTAAGSGGWLDTTVSSTALTAGTDYWLGITSSSVNGYFVVAPSVMDTNEVCKEAGASSLPATATGAAPVSVPLIKVLV